MALTKQQRMILQDAKRNGGTITKKQVVESYKYYYFCNGEKHLGDILSRMVKSGLLIRGKPGVFKVGDGKKSKSEKIIENQQTLF